MLFSIESILVAVAELPVQEPELPDTLPVTSPVKLPMTSPVRLPVTSPLRLPVISPVTSPSKSPTISSLNVLIPDITWLVSVETR